MFCHKSYQDLVDIQLHSFDWESNQHKNLVDEYPMSLKTKSRLINKRLPLRSTPEQGFRLRELVGILLPCFIIFLVVSCVSVTSVTFLLREAMLMWLKEFT